MFPCLSQVFFLFSISFGAQTCLPEAIPEESRSNITLEGISMPIGVSSGDWDAAIIISEIAGILVSKILGYNYRLGLEPTSLNRLLRLAGCTSPESCTTPSSYHIAMEIFGPATILSEFTSVARQMGDTAPQNVGSMGYPGPEGIFVFEERRQQYLADTGLDLAYYFAYNASWFHPENYLASVSEVNMDQLLSCRQSVDVAWPDIAWQYLNSTGDSDGVEFRQGGWYLKCWEDKWWPAPACRSNVSKCIAIVAGDGAWGMRPLVQLAAFHNMPVAFASAVNVETYEILTRTLKSMAFWWAPDTTFSDLELTPVVFPQHNEAEHRKGIFRTGQSVEPLQNWISADLVNVAHRAVRFVQGFRLSEHDVRELLRTHVQSGTDPHASACAWLQTHRDQWTAWVPSQTECTVGRGLVDAQGNFVASRSDAKDCAICPPGRASERSASTFICSLCQVGSFQNSFGASYCGECEPGTISADEGSTQCTLCRLGEFANRSAMSSCFSCSVGAEQEGMWTTSEVAAESGNHIIEREGAKSGSLCACRGGSFLWKGSCKLCPRGSRCPGLNQLELLPGYFSSREAPGDVYECEEHFCPGGQPGTCSDGRDNETVACARCLDGLRVDDGGSCKPCSNADHLLLVAVAVSIICAVAIVYAGLLSASQIQQSRHLLVAVVGITQFVTIAQMLAVLRRYGIAWGEPFASLMAFLEIFSFDLEMLSFDCVTRMNPVASFAIRVLTTPGILLTALVVSLIHAALLAWRNCFRRYGSSLSLQIHALHLLKTWGALFMVLFIVLFSMILAPFQCRLHPNGRYTVQTYRSVHCDEDEQHFQMFVLGILACSMPLLYLALCTWIVMVELPKRLARSDTHFLQACSFLIARFRTGAEISSVAILIRNVLVVLTPLPVEESSRLLMMSLVLLPNLVLVAYFQPWRYAVCNALDIILLSGMLVILQIGAMHLGHADSDPYVSVLMIHMVVMLLAILGTVIWSMSSYLQQKFRKDFKFFLCHQKSAAGSMARLLKIELEKKLPNTKTFVDCDDLNDLTRLFSYVGQDTETFVILGSPGIFTRKWCIGEMVTAWQGRIPSRLLSWPDLAIPDETFIESYSTSVPDIAELVKFGISLTEVKSMLRELGKVEMLKLPGQITPQHIKDVVGSLLGSPGRSPTSLTTNSQAEMDSGCPILVDPDNIEAMASAMVLSSLLKPLLLGTHVPSPFIILKGSSLLPSAKVALMVCSEGCFKSPHIQQWLLQACHSGSCSMIPVIVEESFRIPSSTYATELREVSFREGELHLYSIALQALFQEIAVVFVPQSYSSTYRDLALRCSQAAQRLTAQLQSLQSKVFRLMASAGGIKPLTGPSALGDHLPHDSEEYVLQSF
eukprot:s6003_g1.t1